MPKITAGGGPSHVGAEPGQPGYMPPLADASEEDAPVLKKCGECSTEYAVDLDACPHCGDTQAEEVAGPSYLTGADDAEPGEDPDEPEEEPSPGSSSPTSDEKQPSRSASSETSGPKPAPTTVSPSPKAPAGSSTAGGTATSGRGTRRRGSTG
jgi:hypothetical protein